MCGRFTLFTDDPELATLFNVNVTEGEHAESYNQAPSEWVRVVLGEEPRVMSLFKWGLFPSWAKEGFHPLINARAETLTQKPSFRAAAKRRRCLLPTNGYYEWAQRPGFAGGSAKQPYFISAADGDPLQAPVLAMAGIYELAVLPDGSELFSTAVVTTAAHGKIADIHSRRPVFVPQDAWEEWSDPGMEDPDTVQLLLDSFPLPELTAEPVNKAVGNVRTRDPEVIFGEAALFGEGTFAELT